MDGTRWVRPFRVRAELGGKQANHFPLALNHACVAARLARQTRVAFSPASFFCRLRAGGAVTQQGPRWGCGPCFFFGRSARGARPSRRRVFPSSRLLSPLLPCLGDLRTLILVADLFRLCPPTPHSPCPILPPARAQSPSSLSPDQLFLGSPNKVYVIDKTENNPLRVTPAAGGTEHAAWGSEYDLRTNDVRAMDVVSNSFWSVSYPLPSLCALAELGEKELTEDVFVGV